MAQNSWVVSIEYFLNIFGDWEGYIMTKRRKNHINSKIQGGTHTTLIEAAEKPVRIAEKIPGISRISPGYIKSGIRASKSGAVGQDDNKEGLLTSRCQRSISVQQIRIYHGDLDFVKEQLCGAFKKKGVQVR